MKRFLPIVLFFAASAHAEVFRCVQADGTQVFAYVPCRAEATVSDPDKFASNKQTLLETDDTTDISPVEESKPRSLADIAAEMDADVDADVDEEIQNLESRLGELRLSREADIANAPFNVSDPASLTQLKREIRASYQTEIDQSLDELLHLRQRKRQLETNQPPLGTAD